MAVEPDSDERFLTSGQKLHQRRDLVLLQPYSLRDPDQMETFGLQAHNVAKPKLVLFADPPYINHGPFSSL